MDIQVIGSGSTGNCYVLKSETESLMLECGIPFKKIQQNLDFRLSEVQGCLISHQHL